jgi:hypothetical protein
MEYHSPITTLHTDVSDFTFYYLHFVALYIIEQAMGCATICHPLFLYLLSTQVLMNGLQVGGQQNQRPNLLKDRRERERECIEDNTQRKQKKDGECRSPNVTIID